LIPAKEQRTHCASGLIDVRKGAKKRYYEISLALLVILAFRGGGAGGNMYISRLHLDRLWPTDIVSKGDIAMVNNKGRAKAPMLPARRAARRLPDTVRRLRARQPRWPGQSPRPLSSSSPTPS
jgi:hypothetical protein